MNNQWLVATLFIAMFLSFVSGYFIDKAEQRSIHAGEAEPTESGIGEVL